MNTLITQKQIEFEQVHRSENYFRIRGATQRVLDENNLLTSRIIQAGIDNCCPAITATLPQSIKGKLIQHFTRQIPFPKIAILCIQNGLNLVMAQHKKIRTKRW